MGAFLGAPFSIEPPFLPMKNEAGASLPPLDMPDNALSAQFPISEEVAACAADFSLLENASLTCHYKVT